MSYHWKYFIFNESMYHHQSLIYDGSLKMAKRNKNEFTTIMHFSDDQHISFKKDKLQK